MPHAGPDKVPSDGVEGCLEINKIDTVRNIELNKVVNNSMERMNLVNA